MKRICDDDKETGLEDLLGEKVLFLCASYFYHGTVEAVSEQEVTLADAGIVYETGPWSDSGFSDKQELPAPITIRLSAVESYVAV